MDIRHIRIVLWLGTVPRRYIESMYVMIGTGIRACSGYLIEIKKRKRTRYSTIVVLTIGSYRKVVYPDVMHSSRLLQILLIDTAFK